MIDKRELNKIVQEENENWSRIFQNELKKKNSQTKPFSSYWWELYYGEIVAFVNKKISECTNPKILETGAGSGKASILLGKNLDRTLLDISPKALEYAKFLAKKLKADNLKFIEGNIFDMPFPSKNFDFVWNIGVIEHYEIPEAQIIAKNMIKVTKENGFIALAVPNFRSGPIIKARMLNWKVLNKIPGYRLGSEKKYSEKELIKIIEKAAFDEKRSISDIQVIKFGNPMIMETPKIILQIFGKFFERIFYDRKFLIFVIAKIK